MKISGLAAGGAPQVGDILPIARSGTSVSMQVGAPILAATSLATQGFAVFNSAAAVTLLASGHAAGTFRANIFLVVTTLFVTNTTETISLGFTDDQGARAPVALSGVVLAAGTVGQISYTFRSTGATAITYSPGVTGSAATAGAASFSVVLERLI